MFNPNKIELPPFFPFIIGVVIMCVIFSFIVCAFADEISVSGKVSYNNYSGGGSIYNNNDGFDSELGIGAYINYRKSNYFVRLDFDRLKTGNEFSEHLMVTYEAVDIKQEIMGLTFGTYWKCFYIGAGAGLSSNNSSRVELYPYQKDIVEVKDSIEYHGIIGAETKVSKHIRLFVEGKYMISEADIMVNGVNNHTEDLGSKSLVGGIAYVF